MSNSTTHNDDTFVLFRYTPSLPAAIIFIFCFLATTAWHCFQAWKRRTHYFIPLIVGGCFQWLGYIGRAVAHNDKEALGPYIMQNLLLLLAPALFAASIYMVLGRLINFTGGESISPIPERRLTKLFVCGDVLSFIVQGGGGGLMANSSTMKTGEKLVIAGLVLQIIFFGVFMVTGGLFHMRIIRSPTPASLSVNWQRYMYALYISSALILVRSAFRVIEFAQGNDGVLMSNEVYLYIFDAILMLGAMVIFNFIHPGEIIAGKTKREGLELGVNESLSDRAVNEQQ